MARWYLLLAVLIGSSRFGCSARPHPSSDGASERAAAESPAPAPDPELAFLRAKATELGLALSKAELEAGWQAQVRRLGGAAGLASHLARTGATERSLREHVERRALVERLSEHAKKDAVPVTDAAVRAYYEANRLMFVDPKTQTPKPFEAVADSLRAYLESTARARAVRDAFARWRAEAGLPPRPGDPPSARSSTASAER